MKLGAWRVALRIARRDALRAKGRSALVIAMIALPVLGVTGADVFYRSGELTPTEHVARVMGQADAEVRMAERGSLVLQAPDPDTGMTMPPAGRDAQGRIVERTPAQKRSQETEPAELARQLLPAGTVFVPEPAGSYGAARSAEGLLTTRATEKDLADPVWKGVVDLLDGRTPTADDQVAVTSAFLKRSRLKLGATTGMQGVDSRTFTITAVVEYPGELDATEIIARPGALLASLAQAAGTSRKVDGVTAPGTVDKWLVKLPGGATLDWNKVVELNSYGFAATSRAVLLDPPARADVPYYVEADRRGGGDRLSFFNRTSVVILGTVIGMALLEIVLLAGPAFAVGARRSRRQLGLLAAAGGERANVRAVVLGGGIVLGLTGAAVGIAVGLGLTAALQTAAEERAGSRFGHFNVQPLDLIGILAVGLVTGLLAAVVPAVQASRQEVVSALTSRDSVKPPSRRLAVLGLLMLGGGAAAALLGATSKSTNRSLTVIGGSALAELGMVVLTPFLVGLFGRLGRWLPLGPRLALRDSVRHRGRTAPAVAAVMAAVAGSVAVGIYIASFEEQYRRDYTAAGPSNAVMLGAGWAPDTNRQMLPQLRDAVERNIPDLGPRADVRRVNYKGDCSGNGACGYIAVIKPKATRCPAQDLADSAQPGEYVRVLESDQRCRDDERRGSRFGDLTAGDATLLRNLYGVTDPAAGQALAAGKAVVFDPGYLDKDGKVTLRLGEPVDPTPGASGAKRPAPTDVLVDAVLSPAVLPAHRQAVITPETATRLGLTTTPIGSVWLPGAAPSDGDEQKAAGALGRYTDYNQLNIERGYQSKAGLISIGLSAFAALVALGAAGIATGLAATDSQRDLTTLAAIGAEPRIRRTLSGFQCGVIAAMGTLLGVVCGVVPAIALRKLNSTGYPGMSTQELANQTLIAVPWTNILVTVVVLPLLAAGLAALLTRSRITLLRRSG
ncbi:ABC transporter permease [Streptomyces sp. NRRL WC-3742]|uniref:ABC transporter permease n=1 Tax=Streptomyces sp. NRRL WC-3742 TaxID=1463934 RepID=UPI0004C6E5B0|nr:ABC transporter permease [Streptomyces sp. NRRL WC-3742]